VRGDTIRLHATPVVNLFQKRAAPISLTRQRVDYPLQFDDRTPLDYEVFSIKSVAATSSSRETRQYKSFYDIDRGGSRQPHGYWRLSRRRMAVGSDSADRHLEQEASLQGWLSLTDLEMQPSRANDWVVHVEATCVNRAPHRRWTGASAAESGRVTWSLVGGGAVGQVRLVTVPTAPLRWPAEKGWRWRILSHLSLNHLSLSETEAGVAPLREILELYNPSGGKVLSEQIRGLLAISCRRVTRRIDRASSGVVRGLEARLHLDSAAFPLGDLFLFGSVLQAFLSGYCTINSFVETVLTTSHSEGEYHRWPATAGTRSIL
jgi:type VI secretion system protein ImpG